MGHFLKNATINLDPDCLQSNNLMGLSWRIALTHSVPAESARAAKYTNCISVNGQDSSNEYPGYGTKQSDSVAQIMIELWGMWSTYLLPLLTGPLWSGVVASDRVVSMG